MILLHTDWGDIHFIYIGIAADIIFHAYSARVSLRFNHWNDAVRSATMTFPLNSTPIQTSGWISMIDKEKSTHRTNESAKNVNDTDRKCMVNAYNIAWFSMNKLISASWAWQLVYLWLLHTIYTIHRTPYTTLLMNCLNKLLVATTKPTYANIYTHSESARYKLA